MRNAKSNARDAVIDFEWNVSLGGYRWVTAMARQSERGEPLPLLALAAGDSLLQEPNGVYRRILIPANPFESGGRRSHPLDRDGFHRRMAAVETSENDILNFANQYGTLGLYRQDVDLTRLLDLSIIAFFPADSLLDWQTEIGDLRQGVALWDAAKKIEGDVPAKLDRIATMIRSRLDNLQGVPVRRSNGFGLRMRLGPRSLCAAAWLQFEQETEGFFHLLQCPECGGWFKFYPEQAKTPRIFCSQACRSKAYRKRQQQARSMHGEGVPVAEVAQRLGSDAETVSAWISKGGQKLVKGI